jgi:hypothetical protein
MHEDQREHVIHAPDDDPNALMTVALGVIGCLLLLAILFGLEAVFYSAQQSEYGQKVVRKKPVELMRVQAEQREAIRDYHWIDREAGVVGLPIERSMELLVEEHRGRGAETGSRDD